LKKRTYIHSKNPMSNAFKKRLDLSCIITKTWSGKEVYLECIRKQRVLGNLIHNALQNVQIKDNIHEYYEEYCNAIYETCKDFLSKGLSFLPFKRKMHYGLIPLIQK